MPLPSTMKALVLPDPGKPHSPDEFQLQDIALPEPKDDFVIIKIRAFGINHAEMHMRQGIWKLGAMPIIGIECVGVIAQSLDPSLPVGTPVAAVMGGLGRIINGSYAEYTSAPISNVVKLAEKEQDLGIDWGKVASLPETFTTAWTCLFRNLEIKKGQRLLFRGGTSSFGRAAISLAAHCGVHVTATTRNLSRTQDLKGFGASEVLEESLGLASKITEKYDAILELIGNSTVLSSLNLLHRGGRMCLAGFLGGLDPIKEFNPLLQMASGVHFSFFGSFQFGQPEFPLNDVPSNEIVASVTRNEVKGEPSNVFKFGEEGIAKAHRLMEENKAGGKMVVILDK